MPARRDDDDLVVVMQDFRRRRIVERAREAEARANHDVDLTAQIDAATTTRLRRRRARLVGRLWWAVLCITGLAAGWWIAALYL